MDVILQFYGLFFVVPGLLILVWPKHESEYDLAGLLWLLGIFGVTHGLTEWMSLWRQTHDGVVVAAAGPTLLLVSYVFLLEFGRRLTRSLLSERALSSPLALLVSPWLYVLEAGVIIGGSLLFGNGPHDVVVLSRYCAGFLGATLTGFGFLIYWHRHVKARVGDDDRGDLNLAFHALGGSFIAYGVFGGLLVPATQLSDIVGSGSGLVPVQIGSALSVIVIAASLIYILRMFDIESRTQLENARGHAAQNKQAIDLASQKYDLLLQTASDGIHILDTDGNVVEANDAFCRMLGYSREEILRMHVTQWDAHFSAAELKKRIPMLLGNLTAFETVHRRRDGKLIDVEISTVGVHMGEQILLYCSSRDITDRKYSEAQLRLVARVFDRAAEGVMITDENQRILTVNDSFVTVTGYSREEVIGKTPALLQSGKQSSDFYKNMWEELQANGWWQGEIWNRRKNGELYLEWLSINAVRDEQGKTVNYIGMFSDITVIKESRQRMEYLATHDELTELPNRTLFNDQLRLALARSARAGNHLALMFVDLDNFKLINDTLGHQEGDQLLKQVAARLKRCVRGADTVARLGGDEFVILLEIDNRNEVALMATRILEAFAASFILQEQECFITSSIGISLFPEDTADPHILMRHADTAMYRAKERGKNIYMFFTADMAEQISRRMTVENALRFAIAHDELFIEYQPQIDLLDNALVGVEALLRWRHQDRVLLPKEFIQIAEESGFIVDIDEWVIGEVCKQMRRWDEHGLCPFWVSVNTSARHFRRPDAFARIANIVGPSGITPDRLCLEITEGVLMDIDSATRILYKLHDAGFRVSVDDFGTGFSSLSYLKRLPIHEVKIDRTFVDGIATDPDDRAIATAIVAMARSLGLRTVAEGVETHVQQAELRQLGCNIGQGYFYSRPVGAVVLQEWIMERRKKLG